MAKILVLSVLLFAFVTIAPVPAAQTATNPAEVFDSNPGAAAIIMADYHSPPVMVNATESNCSQSYLYAVAKNSPANAAADAIVQFQLLNYVIGPYNDRPIAVITVASSGNESILFGTSTPLEHLAMNQKFV